VNPYPLTRTLWSNVTVACALVPNRERTLYLFRFRKIFTKIILILKKHQIFQSCQALLLRSRTPFFAKAFTEINISAKICQNLMSSKYFHKNGKNGPFVSHVADKFRLFCNILKEKSTFVNFCENFLHFLTIYRKKGKQ
jgi:hypothetical protein